MSKSDADPLGGLMDREAGSAAASALPVLRGPVRLRTTKPPRVWLYASLLSLFWILAVLAFCWARYGLPFNLSAAGEILSGRIGANAWMLIAAALILPLMVIWIVAALLRRTYELRSETQELASAAMRLATAAKSVEGVTKPSSGIMSIKEEVNTPRHLRREVERATHAISALHGQMNAIEQTLSKQAAAIDDVAERAELRSQSPSSNSASEENISVTRPGAMPVHPTRRVPPPVAGAAKSAGIAGAAVLGGTAAAVAAKKPDIVDMTVQKRGLRDNFLSANEVDEIDPFDDVGISGQDQLDDLDAPLPELPGKESLRAEIDLAEQDGLPNFRNPRRGDIVWEKFIRAANFPANENDSETLDALYEVLTDTEIASLLQSSEDTLASLADINLYMEDLEPTLAPANDWKRYLTHQGRLGNKEPSRGIFTMPGIPAGLEEQKVAAKRGGDSSFTLLSDRFMDRYEEMAVRMLDSAVNPSMLVELADTRTGRAYTLLAQASQRLRHLDTES